MIFSVIYIPTAMIIYREASPIMKGFLVLVFHPVLAELINLGSKLKIGDGKKRHPFYDTLTTSFSVGKYLYIYLYSCQKK